MTLLTSRTLRIAAVSGAALLVASCAETQLGAQAVKEVARNDAAARQTTGPELAPDAFDVTGLTIWDGASTLEGVWVAHPLAQKAQRVRVINQENQVIVEGAMFRRDPTLSGPSILVSSDAARLLGLQPGLPTELRIIALREGVYAEPTATAAQPAPASTVETSTLAAPEPVEPETAETNAATETAVETAEAEPVPAPEPAEPAPTPAAQPAEKTASDPQPEPEDQSGPKSAITAADLRATATPEPATPAQPAAPATAPASPSEPASEPAAAQPAAIPAAQAASSSGAFQGDLPSGLFVQAGAFGVEENAAALVQTLRGSGLPAQYVQRIINGSAFNIVMIGPLADDAAADAAIASAAKAGAAGARKVVR